LRRSGHRRQREIPRGAAFLGVPNKVSLGLMHAPDSLRELIGWTRSDPGLARLLAVVEERQDDDAAHDLSHLFRVALWTLRLGGAELNPREAAAAALLHDLVNLPKNHPERATASERSAREALPLLLEAGFPRESASRVADAIRDHSYSRGAVPATALGKALQDADRLEALGAIGLMRVFSTGARMGASYFHPDDPWSQERPLDDLKYSLDHFFTKLLKLPATFHTPGGRREAEVRAGRMVDFLDQTSAEIGVPRP
jgi:uncharacterized protein